MRYNVRNVITFKDIKTEYSGLVWIISGLIFLLYIVLIMAGQILPGAEKVVAYATSIPPSYLFGVAFLVIFFEGLYIVGTFFPGAGLILLLAALSGANGATFFLMTSFVLFLGWSLAGLVNIVLASLYYKNVLKGGHDDDIEVHGRAWATWLPSFRASYEVAQVVDGCNPVKVLTSSIRVKAIVCFVMALIVFVSTYFI
ncbi:hypothetical protein COB52_01535, partial [Candidatus Kaiserbacteria bacterium]